MANFHGDRRANPAANYMPHMKGYNLLFADGHSKWFLSGQATSLAHFPEDSGPSTRALHPASPYCP